MASSCDTISPVLACLISPNPDFVQRLLHELMVRTVQPLLELVDVDHRRLDLAEQDGVVALALRGSLLQTMPLGKTWKKVAITLLVVSRLLS